MSTSSSSSLGATAARKRMEHKQLETCTRSSSKSHVQLKGATNKCKPTTTTSYTHQYLDRRLRDCDKNDKQRQKTNDSQRRKERRHSSEDLDPLCKSQTLDTNDAMHGDTTSGTRTSPRAVDDAVAAAKGLPAPQEGRDQSVIMAKKRRVSCRKAMGLVMCVMSSLVTGGIAMSWWYPSSFTASWVQIVIAWVKPSLYTLVSSLWSKVKTWMKSGGQVLRIKGLALLENQVLENVARVVKVPEFRQLRDLFQLKALVPMSRGLMDDLHDELSRVALNAINGLKVSMMRMHSDLRKLINDDKLLEQTSVHLSTALSSLTKVLKQSGDVMMSRLDQVYEWLGVEISSSDANLSSDAFLAPLSAHEAALQLVGNEVTAQQSQALHDVKRFEDRRIAITSATNSIIEDTRAFALESVVNVKRAAVEFIEERTRELAHEYVGAFKEAFADYERTSRQVEEEGGMDLLAAMTMESQAQVDAAASLKEYLLAYDKAVDGEPMEARDVAESIADSDFDKEKESQMFAESTGKDVLTVGPAVEYSRSEKTVDRERTSTEQTAEPADERELIDEMDKTSMAQVLVGLDNVALDVELMQVEVAKHFDVQNRSEDEILQQKAQLQQETRVETHVEALSDRTDVKFVDEVNVFAAGSLGRAEGKQSLDGMRCLATAEAGVEAMGDGEKPKMTRAVELCEEALLTGGMDAQSEQWDVDSAAKVQVDADGVEVFAELHDREKDDLTSVSDRAGAVAEMDVEQDSGGGGVVAEQEAAFSTDVEQLESELVALAKEMQELERFEEEEGERIQVEEELRVIAIEEGIWLQKEQSPTEDVAVSGQHRTTTTHVTERAEAATDSKSDDQLTSSGDAALVSSLSMVVAGLAVLILYLLVRHYKHSSLTRSPRCRKRWQRLANMKELEAEEVVLLSDDSSEEEDTTNDALVEQKSVTDDDDVESAAMSEDEEDDEQEESSSSRIITQEDDDVVEEEGVAESAQTTMNHVEHPVTSDSDALTDDSDIANVSLSTPRQKTSERSQRTRHRQYGIPT